MSDDLTGQRPGSGCALPGCLISVVASLVLGAILRAVVVSDTAAGMFLRYLFGAE